MKKLERKIYRKELFDFNKAWGWSLFELVQELTKLWHKEATNFDKIIVDWNTFSGGCQPVVVGIKQESEEEYQKNLHEHKQKQIARINQQREKLEKEAKELGL